MSKRPTVGAYKASSGLGFILHMITNGIGLTNHPGRRSHIERVLRAPGLRIHQMGVGFRGTQHTIRTLHFNSPYHLDADLGGTNLLRRGVKNNSEDLSCNLAPTHLPFSPLISSGLESILLQENGLDQRELNLKFPTIPYQCIINPIQFCRTDQRLVVPGETPAELYPLKRRGGNGLYLPT